MHWQAPILTTNRRPCFTRLSNALAATTDRRSSHHRPPTHSIPPPNPPYLTVATSIHFDSLFPSISRSFFPLSLSLWINDVFVLIFVSCVVYIFWFYVIIFVWILRKCEKHDKNGFSIAFSAKQPNTWKYFPFSKIAFPENILHEPNTTLFTFLFSCTIKRRKWYLFLIFLFPSLISKHNIKESINHIGSTTLYYKITNMYLTFFRNYKCSNIFIFSLLTRVQR